MFNIFKKKPKIEFFSYIPGVAETCPVLHAKDRLPSWTVAMRENYKDTVRKTEARVSHTYRCPGIFEILREGYIMTMPWDVIIETRNDPWHFKWTVPDSTLAELMDPVPLITSHTEAAKGIPTPLGAMDTIIKFNLPWHVKAPKGVKLLFLPLSYDDNQVFTHVPGLLDPGYSSEINFLLRWYKWQGTYTIKAGTPMAHVIPVTAEHYDMVCREANNWDRFWLEKRKYIFNYSFTPRRKQMKQAYQSHYENDNSK